MKDTGVSSFSGNPQTICLTVKLSHHLLDLSRLQDEIFSQGKAVPVH